MPFGKNERQSEDWDIQPAFFFYKSQLRDLQRGICEGLTY
jgi:hypothetical protein